MANGDQNPAPLPKMSFTQWVSAGPNLVGIALVILLALGAYLMLNGILRPQPDVDGARSLLASLFSIATIVLAFSLMIGAFLTSGDNGAVKERFNLALQVFTPLIGIMGTILGFYFGTADKAAPNVPLAVADVVAPAEPVVAGKEWFVTVLTQGGRAPWTYELDFGKSIPKITKSSGQSYLREAITLPAEAVNSEATIGLNVTVTDAAGAKATWERKPGNWVTVKPATPNTTKTQPQVPAPMPAKS